MRSSSGYADKRLGLCVRTWSYRARPNPKPYIPTHCVLAARVYGHADAGQFGHTDAGLDWMRAARRALSNECGMTSAQDGVWGRGCNLVKSTDGGGRVRTL